MRCAVGLVVAAAVAAAGAAPCAACSCVPGDTRDMLRAADAAFVGVLLKKETKDPPMTSSVEPAIYTFRVEEKIKGSFGGTVAVESPVSGASCGLEVGVGRRIGILLARRGGAWRSNLCMQLAPAELRAAARPLPRPNGTGAAELLVAGGFGEARTIALDSRGRTLAYGLGRGDAAALATCPGGRRVAELVVGDVWAVGGRSRVRLAIRTLPRLRTVREIALPQRLLNLQKQEVLAFGCSDAAARDVFVAARSGLEGAANATTILRLRGRAVTVLYSGFASAVTLGRSRAYLAEGPRGTHLVAFDLEARARRRLGTLPPNVDRLAASADGRHVAGVAFGAGRVALVRTHDGARRVATFPPQDHGGNVLWASLHRLLLLPSPIGDASVFDTSLRRVARIAGWSGAFAAAGRRRVYGVAFNGEVVAARLPTGPTRPLRKLPGRSVYAVAPG